MKNFRSLFLYFLLGAFLCSPEGLFAAASIKDQLITFVQTKHPSLYARLCQEYALGKESAAIIAKAIKERKIAQEDKPTLLKFGKRVGIVVGTIAGIIVMVVGGRKIYIRCKKNNSNNNPDDSGGSGNNSGSGTKNQDVSLNNQTPSSGNNASKDTQATLNTSNNSNNSDSPKEEVVSDISQQVQPTNQNNNSNPNSEEEDDGYEEILILNRRNRDTQNKSKVTGNSSREADNDVQRDNNQLFTSKINDCSQGNPLRHSHANGILPTAVKAQNAFLPSPLTQSKIDRHDRTNMLPISSEKGKNQENNKFDFEQEKRRLNNFELNALSSKDVNMACKNWENKFKQSETFGINPDMLERAKQIAGPGVSQSDIRESWLDYSKLPPEHQAAIDNEIRENLPSSPSVQVTTLKTSQEEKFAPEQQKKQDESNAAMFAEIHNVMANRRKAIAVDNSSLD